MDVSNAEGVTGNSGEQVPPAATISPLDEKVTP
jgi:hypothetical protein